MHIFMQLQGDIMSIIKEFDFDGFFFHHSIDKKPDENMFVMHTHGNYEIFMLIKGDCEYRIEGSIYPLMPFDVLIMRPMEFHKLYVNSSKTYERVVMQFSPDILSQIDPAQELLQCFNQRNLGENNLIPAKTSIVKSLVDNFTFLETHTNKACSISVLIKLLTQINEVYSSDKHTVDIATSDSVVQKVIAYINENITETITLDTLENYMFLNKFHLNRMFKKATGSTIVDYIIKKRLLLAQHFIKTGYTPNNACKACGFGEYSSFFRAYKNHFGVSPKMDMKTK